MWVRVQCWRMTSRTAGAWDCFQVPERTEIVEHNETMQVLEPQRRPGSAWVPAQEESHCEQACMEKLPLIEALDRC